MAVAGYEYRIDGGSPVDMGLTNPVTASGLTAATSYDFEFRAYDGAGNRSAWTSIVSESTDAFPGLIDVVGQSAAAAYGVRKLRGAYAGSAVRVRRASDNAEQDIGFSGEALDWASAISFKGASTIFVKTWYDQSGGSADLTQATAASQAGLDTSGEQLTFDGSNDFYSVALDLSASDKLSAFMVAASATNADYQILLEHNTGAAANDLLIFTNSGAVCAFYSQVASVGNAESVNSFTSGADRLVTVITDRSLTGSSIVKARVDASNANDVATSNISGNYANANLNVGARNNGSTFFIAGSMKEIVLFQAALNNTERDDGEANINTYHTIY
jgi:hypothetical protein